MSQRRVVRWAASAGAVAALLLYREGAAPALGQTVPLRPTPTVAGDTFQTLPQPTPPVPTPLPATTFAAASTGAPSLTDGQPTVASPTSPGATAPAAPAATVLAPAPSAPAAGKPLQIEHANVPAEDLPPLPPGWRLAGSQLRISGTPAGQPVSVALSTRDLAAAAGAPSALLLFQVVPDGSADAVSGEPAMSSKGQWRPAPHQSPSSAGEPLRFAPDSPGLFVLLARVLPPQGDYAISGGWFFRTPDFPAGGGFSVTDDGARLWTAYQAAGGEAALGRPISRRYLAGGDLVQAFERGTLVAPAGGAAAQARPGTTWAIPMEASVPEPAPWPG